MAALTTTTVNRLAFSGVSTGSGLAWNNPTNTLTAGATFSQTAQSTKSAKYSKYLKVTNFGFNIPADAVILGITVRKAVNASKSSKVYDRTTQLLKTSGAVGDNYATAGYWQWWATGIGTRTYGGAADTWNAGLTPADINSSDFGIQESLNCTEAGIEGRCYWIDISVTYSYAEVAYDRISNPFSLSEIIEVDSSSMDWTSVEPAYTDIKMYSALSSRNTIAPMGYALSLTGTNGAFISAIEFTSAMTCCAWIKPTAIGRADSIGNTAMNIISRYYNVTTTHEYCWDLSFASNGSDIIQFRVENTIGSLVSAYGPSAINDATKWYHIAGVYDGSNVIVYVNGVAGTPVALTGDIVSRGTRQIGIGSGIPMGGSQPSYNGYIDEISLWDYALTQGEIEANMYTDLDGLGSGDGLACYIKCDEYTTESGPTYYLVDETGYNTVLAYSPALVTSGAGWYEQTASGGTVGNYTVGDDLTSKYLWSKQELIHTDDAVTPELSRLTTTFYSSATDNIEIEINGDVTTYNSIDAVSGGGYVLGGIPSTGSYALKAKTADSYVKYIDTYTPGTLWALSYNRTITDLTDSDFTYPSGYTGELLYLDKRYGRIILTEPIVDYLNEDVLCTTDYEFNTLQATGIEINRKVFRERELDNRFEAINFLRKYLAPNYIIRTIGDNKVWASYLTQKSIADYDLSLVTSMDYMEDEDLYTRSIIWTKNENPTNVMFGDDVDYEVDNVDAYTGIASKEELMYIGDEKSGRLSAVAQAYLTEAEQFDGTDPTVDVINYLKDKYIIKDFASQPTTGYRIYATPISNEYGKIIAGDITPLIWLNGVPVDNKVHRIDSVPVKISQKVVTVTEGGGKSKSTSTYTYYYYTVYFPHTSIEPTEQIHLYDLQGQLQYTIEPGDANMDYGSGVWTLPGQSQNSLAETISTAGYDVFYDSSKVDIDYEDVVFKVDKSLTPDPEELVVRATFEYWSIAVGVRDIRAVVDGRRDTQLQLQFFGSPISGFHLATIDMGAVYNVQAVDVVGGFYKPDEYRKFDVDFTVSMQYSVNGTDFYPISDATEQVRVSGGKAITFEEADLGIGLEARYLKFNLYDVARVNYGKGRYVVAITEISVYNDIVLKGEASIIPTTTLDQPVGFGDTEVYLVDSSGFTDPDSGEEATAYFDKDVSFTYTGIDSGSVLTGCDIQTGTSYTAGYTVTQAISGDTTIYDEDYLLPHLGDRVAKKNEINDRNLYSQYETDTLSKAYLLEYYKDHSKAKVSVMYSPYLKIGQTINVTDTYNNKNNVKYFIESIAERSQGVSTLTLARYPAL